MTERTVRAKFRCMSTMKVWDGTSRVELKPVGRKSGGNFPENAAFWKYTPTGEATLHFPVGVECPFKAGDFYYIDMSQAFSAVPHPGWVLNSALAYGAGSGEVVLTQSYMRETPVIEGLAAAASYGSLKLGLSGESATVGHFGEPGRPWRVVFTFANDGAIED